MAYSKAVLLAVVAAVVLSLASAQDSDDDEHLDQPDHAEPALTQEDAHWLHQKMDKNGDGKVSMKEVLSFHDHTQRLVHTNESAEIFDDLDKNGDGKLTLEEIEGDDDEHKSEEETEEESKQMVAQEKEKFALADVNGDGSLDRKEAVPMFFPESHHGMLEITSKPSFKDRDLDKDGKIDAAEYHQWSLRGEAGEDIVDGMESEAEEKREFELLDENGDGTLDLKEFIHVESGRVHVHMGMESMFKIADKDKDSHLTADEINDAIHDLHDTDAHFPLADMCKAKGFSDEL